MASAKAITAGKAYVIISAIDQTHKTFGKITKKVNAMALKMQSIGTELMMGGAIGTIGAALPIAQFAKFEDAMLAVQAKMQATDEEYQQLTKLAQHYGETTSYTAKEVADTMVVMAQMGLKAGDVENSLGAILNAARATGTELPAMSDYILTAIRAFGGSFADAADYADVMTAACNNSALNMEMLGDTMTYCAKPARDAGVNIRQLTTLIGHLANQGIRGSNAGTALRRMFTNLATEREKLEAHGIYAFDDGRFKNIDETITQIREVASAMSDIERITFLKDIFGQYALASMLSLATDEYSELSAAMQDCSGVAQETSNIMDSKTGGTFRLIWSVVERLGNAIGESFSSAINGAREGVIEFLQEIVRWVEVNQKLVVGIGLGVVTMGGLGAALVTLGTAIRLVTFALSGFNVLLAGTALLTSLVSMGMFVCSTVAAALSAAYSLLTFATIANTAAFAAHAAGILFSLICYTALFIALETLVITIVAAGAAFAATSAIVIAAGVIFAGLGAIIAAVSVLVWGFTASLLTAYAAAGGGIATLLLIAGGIFAIAAAVYATWPVIFQFVGAVAGMVYSVVSVIVAAIGQVLYVLTSMVIGILRPVVSALGWVLRAAITFIGAFIRAIVAVVQTIGTFLAGAFYVLFRTAVDILTPLVSVIYTVLSAIGQVLMVVLSPILDFFGMVFQWLGSILLSAVTALVSGVKALFLGLVKVICWPFEMAFRVAVGTVSFIFSSIYNGITGLVIVLGRGLGYMGQAVWNGLSAIGRLFSQLWNIVATEGSAFWNNLVSDCTSTFSAISAQIAAGDWSGAFETAILGLRTIWTDFQSFFLKAWHKTMLAVSDIWHSTRTEWKSWTDGISTLLNAAYAKATMSEEKAKEYMGLLQGIQNAETQRLIDERDASVKRHNQAIAELDAETEKQREELKKHSEKKELEAHAQKAADDFAAAMAGEDGNSTTASKVLSSLGLPEMSLDDELAKEATSPEIEGLTEQIETGVAITNNILELAQMGTIDAERNFLENKSAMYNIEVERANKDKEMAVMQELNEHAAEIEDYLKSRDDEEEAI